MAVSGPVGCGMISFLDMLLLQTCISPSIVYSSPMSTKGTTSYIYGTVEVKGSAVITTPKTLVSNYIKFTMYIF